MTHLKTILVVDDSRLSRMMSRQYILSRQPGWQIDEAASGEQALEQVSRRLPDLVLLDLNMPGMGGLAAAAVLRARHPGLRIVLLTANVQEATQRQAAELGLGFLPKPIMEAQIHAALAPLEALP